jgi:hypothetical protein
MNNKEEQKEEMISIKEAAAVAGVSTVLFALYVQFSPKMGNIWIRKNDEGEDVFVPKNLLNLMVEPFTNKQFWHPRNLDMNWLFLTASCLGLYTGAKAIKGNLNK